MHDSTWLSQCIVTTGREHIIARVCTIVRYKHMALSQQSWETVVYLTQLPLAAKQPCWRQLAPRSAPALESVQLLLASHQAPGESGS